MLCKNTLSRETGQQFAVDKPNSNWCFTLCDGTYGWCSARQKTSSSDKDIYVPPAENGKFVDGIHDTILVSWFCSD